MRHIHLEQCDSTQDVLERQLEEAGGEDILVSTSRQMVGRGRASNTWEHLPGALAFSFTCPPHPKSTWQSLEVAVCLEHFLSAQFSANLQLKWPNDLYSEGKKCGGILLKNQGQRVLVGVGLNLRPSPLWGHAISTNISLEPDWASELPKKFVESYLSLRPLPINEITETNDALAV